MVGQYECEGKAEAEDMCHDEWNLNALLINN